MRIDFRDGMWAELRERISHGADVEIKKAYRRAADDSDAIFDVQGLVVRYFLRTFSIVDPDGVTIPTDAPDAVTRMPEDIVDRLFEEATKLYAGVRDPNPPTPS